jgi:hypothetical protein
MVSSGTRLQYPPVYGDLSSIAAVLSVINDLNYASRWLINKRLEGY